MQNGNDVGFSNSFTQTIILKKPGSNSLFYMITPDLQGGLAYNVNYPNSKGINYAIIDMSLNNGLGSVISVFNPLKDISNCEKLTAILHSNGGDIWLIGHEYGNNNFFSFLITSSGINTTPIISNVGPTIYTSQGGIPGDSKFDAIGELKASPSGKKLAFTCYYNGTTCLADFNKTTGVISNPITLEIESGGYGVSFSPDNSKLYISGVDVSTDIPDFSTNGKVYQFDITSNNPTAIQNSRTIIYTDPNGMFRSLKIGTDGKIYVARGNGSGYLGVINNPNSSGLNCNYVHNGIYLNGLQGRWGLNNAIEDSSYNCLEASVSEISNKYKVSNYPNPLSNQLTFSTDNSEQTTVFIYNFLGQPILQHTFTNSTLIKTQNFATGIYFYELYNTKSLIGKGKVIKQ